MVAEKCRATYQYIGKCWLYKAIITAEIKSASPQDHLMERIASRLTIEHDVIKESWEVIGQHSDI